MDLVRLQQLHGEWAMKNIPEYTTGHTVMGLAEGVKVLARLDLDPIEKLKGTHEEHRVQKAEAIRDILAALMHYATLERFDVNSLVQKMWEDINKRDWLRNRVDGVCG